MSSSLAGVKELLKVSEEITDAVATNKPIVALESTIYTHGALGNELALQHSDLVRSNGGIPAIIAIVDGVPTVGATASDILRMIESGSAVKASRRDIAYIAGMGLTGQKIHGGTTISGTMLLARLAGIRVFGTGGLGGVHRGGHDSMDVSADLTELGRTRVAVISSGCKGFLDIPRTLEFLETQGAHVSTFADGRSGKIDFPAFWARDSGIKSPSVVQTEKEAAAIILAQERLGIESGLLFANPIPEEFGIPAPEMQAYIEQAVREANEKGFTGSANTPYILGRLKELTGEKAVIANKALVTSNITRATNIAVELSRLLSSGSEPVKTFNSFPVAPSAAPTELKNPAVTADSKADILVAGSVAVDLSCDYAPKSGDTSPVLHTSNPSSISQSIGGVGHNVALAAHSVSKHARVRLCSMVGDDVAGKTILNGLKASGLDTTYIRQLGHEYHGSNRTAQYVAVNDANKNLVMAMADMGIFTNHSFPEYWKSAVRGTKPKWLVVDGNWSEKDIRAWLKAGQDQDCKIAFEPVSTAKSMNLFCPQKGHPKLRVFPKPTVDIASPNSYELAAMYSAARENGYLESPEWFDIIDSFGMRGARDRFVRMTSAELTDAGVPVQSVQLLPYIPTIVTKLGPQGVLLTTILGKDDPRLRDPDSEEYIVARSTNDHPSVGGLYMRLFSAAEKVQNIVSVNGVGDTFFGVLISGLAQGGKVENLIDVAQAGSCLTLKSHESVSPDLHRLEKFESEDEAPQKKPTIALYDKDSDEEELERLVLGNKAGFRAQLFKDDGLFDSTWDVEGKELQLAEQDPGLEDIEDADLFMFDTGAAPGTAQITKAAKSTDGNAPVWEDSDDDRLAISLAGATRLRKLRQTEAEDLVSGTEYSRRLRQQYLRLNPLPAWAREADGRPSKRRRSSAASDSSADDDSDSEISAQPLEKFLRDVNSLAGAGSTKKRRLRPEVIDIQRTREIPDKHKAPVACLSFHPEYPVLLSSSTASVLYLHHIAPAAHPTPNPQLTSVQVKQVDVRRAEFLYPHGDKVIFAGRRKYFHHWDLKTGTVQKTTQILGHRLEHKTMERFRLSPCGRYMAIVASTRKGGGIINILNTTSMQWIAAARLSSQNGIADFAWWSTGNGMTILGRDGQVGEYSMESRSFVGIWHDEGCVGGIVLALGGHQGPAALGDDRWVAVGSNSGITNIYDRNELVVLKSEEVTIKERPTPTRVFEQLVTPITHITFSPDGQLMAFGSQHKKDALRLVHLPTCTVYRNWPTEQTPLGRITAVAFGNQSDLLAVGNDTGKIRLWEIRS
ncbi:Indigoidine synthase A like protein-domain-containing protein [Fusarium tricinctum]|uniref:Indigoidine synthase A like protein-domain-containing protein n=1 Tax=Fusarium tricinctum TaxID=61284 RepID=A0A8K0WEV1_9HYPO|nr:Indigoidine synthase A like protein-domain-containing protein [Fusarium tricinctum]